ncbi:hypothetical protein WN51_12083 [Melipona quadrifasciata]|uniref:Uncharacterized protein n=1 Tax=Melipona quadrifasciata TaxID=166423 RepID=A0A0M9A3L5_9HYME|nr:hypothetical protein WN51_12083 [Melipona quadrifasciata]
MTESVMDLKLPLYTDHRIKRPTVSTESSAIAVGFEKENQKKAIVIQMEITTRALSSRASGCNFDARELRVIQSRDAKVKSEADETLNNLEKKVRNCSTTSPLAVAIVSRLRNRGITKRILEPSWD